MERRRNEEAGETGDPRENPPTNEIVRHESQLRKFGARCPGRGLNLVRFVGRRKVAPRAYHKTRKGEEDLLADRAVPQQTHYLTAYWGSQFTSQ
ncbi:hypothetical protein PR048_031590 [Dryococelus australis]|uniref:Uncharacterized protein n=1 Tax=Dryococelus australis TaxID=614101 RepID=A0ABQ9G5P8_9NEOP|nr:hypothetical protein PR048_031590 [Dryococelus australis]